jgi:hypothetical protein
MKSDNEKLYLEVLHECLFHVSPIPFAEIISPDCLWQNVQLAGYEPLEGFHVVHEENVNAFSRVSALDPGSWSIMSWQNALGQRI